MNSLKNNKNTEITIIYKQKDIIIELKNDRLIYCDKEFDYVIIQILRTDEIFKKIKDKDYFEIDNYIMNNESQNNYMLQDICIVQYPDANELSFAQGRINSFNNYK